MNTQEYKCFRRRYYEAFIMRQYLRNRQVRIYDAAKNPPAKPKYQVPEQAVT